MQESKSLILTRLEPELDESDVTQRTHQNGRNHVTPHQHMGERDRNTRPQHAMPRTHSRLDGLTCRGQPSVCNPPRGQNQSIRPLQRVAYAPRKEVSRHTRPVLTNWSRGYNVPAWKRPSASGDVPQVAVCGAAHRAGPPTDRLTASRLGSSGSPGWSFPGHRRSGRGQLHPAANAAGPVRSWQRYDGGANGPG